jgi:hypothetical protein
MPNYIYAIGEIDIRFPSLDVEREFWQSSGNPKLIEKNEKLERPPDERYHHVERGDTLINAN